MAGAEAARAEVEAEAEGEAAAARLASSSTEMRGDRGEIARISGEEIRRRSAAERGMETEASREGCVRVRVRVRVRVSVRVRVRVRVYSKP